MLYTLGNGATHDILSFAQGGIFCRALLRGSDLQVHATGRPHWAPRAYGQHGGQAIFGRARCLSNLSCVCSFCALWNTEASCGCDPRSLDSDSSELVATPRGRFGVLIAVPSCTHASPIGAESGSSAPPTRTPFIAQAHALQQPSAVESQRTPPAMRARLLRVRVRVSARTQSLRSSMAEHHFCTLKVLDSTPKSSNALPTAVPRLAPWRVEGFTRDPPAALAFTACASR